MTAVAGELWQLVVAYLKQETIEPLKGLVRFLGAGAGAMFCFGIAAVLLILAALRALQTETGDAFDGNLTVVPYLIVFVGAIVIAGLAGRAIGAEKRRSDRAKEGTS
ncbi:MAG: hypothetical protein QOG87_2125 [Actinomycetota bacterium]|jgi:hypothetical protein